MLKPAPSEWRDLRRGMTGHDVAAWQAVQRTEERPVGWQYDWPISVDGSFGTVTLTATLVFQSRRGLVADGIVGPSTRALVDPTLFTPPAPIPDSGLPPIAEIPAKYWRYANRKAIDIIVMHSAEIGEFHSSAEAVANYFHLGPRKPSSSHLVVDVDSIVRCVKDEHVAFHAPPNERSLGIEQAGYAKQTREEWLDPYGVSMLRLVARLIRFEAEKWDIPLEWLGPDELRAGARGLTTHNDVRLAWGETDHTDPGIGYPKDVVLDWATAGT